MNLRFVQVDAFSDRLGRTRFSAFQASARGGHLDCDHKGDRVVLYVQASP